MGANKTITDIEKTKILSLMEYVKNDPYLSKDDLSIQSNMDKAIRYYNKDTYQKNELVRGCVTLVEKFYSRCLKNNYVHSLGLTDLFELAKDLALIAVEYGYLKEQSVVGGSADYEAFMAFKKGIQDLAYGDLTEYRRLKELDNSLIENN